MPIATIARTLGRLIGGADDPVIEVKWCVGEDVGTTVAPAGEPIRLVFHCTGSNPASAHVCFPDFGLLVGLKPHAKTNVDLGRRRPGRYRFYAPDEPDLEGWLIVRP